MKNIVKNIIAIVLIFIAISLIFSSIEYSTPEVKTIGLSELATQINSDQVKEIVVQENDLTITLKENDTKEKMRKESETSLTESLKNLGVPPEKITAVPIKISEPSGFLFWLGALLPFILPFLIVGAFLWYMLKQAQKGNMQAFSFTKSKARVASQKEKITFADVAGLKEAKEELFEVVDFLKNPKKFIDIGAKIPRGVLLMGPPGTGKTLLARAVAGEAGVPFFHISGSEFVEMFVGVGASRVRDLFANAKKAAPCIVFIDEIDAVGRQRGAGLGGGNDEREQTLNQILVEMDGFDRDTNVIVVTATNRPDVLDPALLRPGRFDRKVVLDEPDISDRLEVLKIHMKNKHAEKEVDLQMVAQRTPGFSGADLANLVNEAAILSARRNKKKITQEELLESIEKVMLGPERKSRLLSEKEKQIAAYHEAGHAVLAHILPDADPVHKVSIISRGMAAGYTLKLPDVEKRFYSKKYFTSEIIVSLGGYTAEKMVFGDLTTGSSSDLEKATETARKLVMRYGMSEKLGPIVFGEREELVFLGREISEKRTFSEEVASKIDQEIEALLQDAHKNAQRLLKTHKAKLDKIAKRLIEKETIEKKEFEELMAN
jgi:cell division protease FtsH